MPYAAIVRECERLWEEAIFTDPDAGARVVTAQSLDMILESCDDPEHAADPLAQALYNFILARGAKLVLPDS